MANVILNANNVSVNPFELDTPWTSGTIPAALVTSALGGLHWFRRILWTAPTTVGHQCIIQDINGNDLFNETCATANQSVVLWQNDKVAFRMPKQGKWVLLTLGSGKVLFYK